MRLERHLARSKLWTCWKLLPSRNPVWRITSPDVSRSRPNRMIASPTPGSSIRVIRWYMSTMLSDCKKNLKALLTQSRLVRNWRVCMLPSANRHCTAQHSLGLSSTSGIGAAIKKENKSERTMLGFKMELQWCGTTSMNKQQSWLLAWKTFSLSHASSERTMLGIKMELECRTSSMNKQWSWLLACKSEKLCHWATLQTASQTFICKAGNRCSGATASQPRNLVQICWSRQNCKYIPNFIQICWTETTADKAHNLSQTRCLEVRQPRARLGRKEQTLTKSKLHSILSKDCIAAFISTQEALSVKSKISTMICSPYK